ncbi:TlpA disulfide reductase family protein [Cryptosporangium aurantiacum]|uniref:Peroxiredoxin n=1 Tax=Cryptosporangium aurantiacum TaxID=134849 RepID=A0A1M7RGE5_9ACTN|nr:TlpA disulfide reductase family protein [Cryptosporangium aurantiacum]SHN45375.1 Peroxiredoxin [Cryptosporangium aurantiacum]
METWTLLDGSTPTALRAEVDSSGTLRAAPGQDVFGWHRSAPGWCRGDACIPSFRVADLETDDGLDVVGFAALAGLVTAVDPETRTLATVPDAASRGRDLTGTVAPELTLPTLTGEPFALSSLLGTKVALVFWASWCGCRYDLGAWQERHAAWASAGFTVVTIALDADRASAAPWHAEAGTTHPALVDVDGVAADAFDIVNVPTVVWLDEDGRIVRPQDSQTATDRFRDWNHLSADASAEALRRWVVNGDPGLTLDQVREHLRLPSDDDQRARAETRLASWLATNGHADAAERHFAAAADAAPHNVALRRSAMPQRGIDPFGDEYFRLAGELAEAGVPLHRPLT